MHVHHFLKQRADAGLSTRVVQIGAMDGTTTDHMHRFLSRYDWPALLVEPVAEYFAQLRDTYAGRDHIMLANLAVTDHCGQVPMYCVDPDAIARGLVPPWGRGASSLYPDRNALIWDDVRPHVRPRMVDCVTLPVLLERYGMVGPDALQIDAEGHDYAILRQLDFTRNRPVIINIEAVNLPADELTACQAMLTQAGYIHARKGYDLVAVENAYLEKMGMPA